MATQEYYIREASENEARGPFNFEQLVSLAETGQLTPDTLWYDPSVEDWAQIGTNDELKAQIFPEKRKLRMKVKEAAPQPKQTDSMAPITVEDMLAGAEGRTSETKDKIDPAIMQAHAARIGMWSAVACLVLAAAGEVLPVADAIAAMDLNKILAQPLVFLGGADLFIAVMLGLGVVQFYPMVRFRAALGLGLFGFIFFVQGSPLPLLAEAAGAVGLYLMTIWIDMMPVLVVSALGVLGSAATAYFLLST
jgi:GYF domain 2